MSMMRLRTVGTGVAGAPWYLNAYFAGTDQDAADDAFTRWDAFIAKVCAMTQAGVTFTHDKTAVVINPATGLPTNVLNLPQAGSRQGGDQNQLLPTSNQIVVALKTGVFQAGRQIQGRINLPGRTQSSVGTGGNVSASVASTMATELNGLIADGDDRGLVVYSRKVGLEVEVASATINQKFGVLRSRRD